MRLNKSDKYVQPEKLRKPLIVPCRLSDCIYYERAYERDAMKCLCSHPHKKDAMSESACPLYRLDWQKKSAMLPDGSGLKKPFSNE